MKETPIFNIAPSGAKHEILKNMLLSSGFKASVSEEKDACAYFYITAKAQNREDLLARGVKPVEYLKDGSFKKKNGILTAEAAIAVAAAETDFALCSCSALIIGSGCIAKPLAGKLKALGAFVTVSARDGEALSALRMSGISTCELYCMEGDYDIIFNTVPAQILTDEVLSKLSPSAVIIDLASLPGGVDKAAAQARGIKVIPALALPGKYMPKTAAKIIYETVINAVKEL